MPSSHQSIELVCPVLFNTSGARYSSVPTKELVNANGSATRRGVSRRVAGFEPPPPPLPQKPPPPLELELSEPASDGRRSFFPPPPLPPPAAAPSPAPARRRAPAAGHDVLALAVDHDDVRAARRAVGEGQSPSR